MVGLCRDSSFAVDETPRKHHKQEKCRFSHLKNFSRFLWHLDSENRRKLRTDFGEESSRNGIFRAGRSLPQNSSIARLLVPICRNMLPDSSVAISILRAGSIDQYRRRYNLYGVHLANNYNSSPLTQTTLGLRTGFDPDTGPEALTTKQGASPGRVRVFRCWRPGIFVWFEAFDRLIPPLSTNALVISGFP